MSAWGGMEDAGRQRWRYGDGGTVAIAAAVHGGEGHGGSTAGGSEAVRGGEGGSRVEGEGVWRLEGGWERLMGVVAGSDGGGGGMARWEALAGE